jgi:HPt (histidine-containing phosphotransfer) domain-containing protein
MSTPSATPVFDLEASLRRMGQDRQLFREMVELLCEDGPRRLGDVLEGLDEHSAPRIGHAAHALKGLTANFSAARAVAAAARVEHLARQTQWDEIEPAVAELDDSLAELIAAARPFAEHDGDSF